MMKLRKNPIRAEELLKQFLVTYQKQELSGILKLFCKDINLWGTGVDEYRLGLSEVETQIKRDWKEAKVKEIITLSPIISPNSSCAAGIFKINLEVSGKDRVLDHLRLTIVTAIEEQILKIAYMHASVPDIQQPEGKSFRAF